MPTCDHGCSNFASHSTANRYAPYQSIESVHIKSELNVDVTAKKTEAKITHTVEAKREGQTIVFNGESFLNLTARLVDGKDSEAIDYRYDGSKITVTFNKSLKPKERRTIEISYRIENPIDGLFFSPTIEEPNGVEYVITDHESERARYWLACIDHPNVRTTLEFLITAKKEFSIYANGILQSEKDNENGTKTSHWKLDQVCPSYLICFAVGNFTSVKDNSYRIPMEYISVTGTSQSDLTLSFGNTPQIMQWLENKVGTPFPYPKYYQIAVPAKRGAMENVSLTSWGQYFVVDKIDKVDWGWVTEIVNVHEMTHSYFGDSIGMRYFEHAWLKESWATYMEWCWLEEKYSKNEYQFELFDSYKSYSHECNTYVRPIVTTKYDSSWNMFDMHLYPGGAWRIHMLRKIMGDEAFWKAIQEYVSTNLHKLVETDDFRRILEKHSNLNLTQFFDEWIYGRGFPKLKGNFNWDSEKKLAQLTLEQTQKDEKLQIENFNFQLEIQFTDESGKIIETSLSFDGTAKASTSVSMATKPTMIIIDPSMKVLFSLEMNPGEDILKNTLEKAPTVSHKIWAAKELVKIGSVSALNSLDEVLKKEQFYGVKYEAASELADCKSPLATKILCNLLEREQDPYTLMKLASASKIKDKNLEKIIIDLLLKIEQRPLSYRTKMHLLEALGIQRNIDHFDLLKKFADDQSHQGFVRSGAFKGIGNLRTKEAYDFLKNRVKSDKNESRHNAVAAFAEAASWQNPITQKEAIEFLAEIVYDSVPLVKKAVVEGLVKLQAKSHIELLENVKKTFPSQEYGWIDKRINQLKEKGDDPAVTKLKKDLEDLTSYVKKLEEKLDDLSAKKN